MCHPFEEATNWRGKWWVGTRARLSGHPFQEKLGLATTPGYRPTHPTIPNLPVQIAAEGNKFRQEKISRNWMIFITPPAISKLLHPFYSTCPGLQFKEMQKKTRRFFA